MANKLEWDYPEPVSLSTEEAAIKQAVHVVCTEYEGSTTKFFEQLRAEEPSQNVKSRAS